jgi:CDP-6-deoxy-D-xylo-4-hexulose-3-dehydrase
MDRVMELVDKHNLILLEDCCDGLGTTYDGKPLGSFGEMASCSFYPAHHMTMGEGGFVAMNDPQQEIIVRSLREWGRGCYCVGPEANKLKCGTCGRRFNEWIPEMPDQIFDHKYVYDEIGYIKNCPRYMSCVNATTIYCLTSMKSMNSFSTCHVLETRLMSVGLRFH